MNHIPIDYESDASQATCLSSYEHTLVARCGKTATARHDEVVTSRGDLFAYDAPYHPYCPRHYHHLSKRNIDAEQRKDIETQH